MGEPFTSHRALAVLAGLAAVVVAGFSAACGTGTTGGGFVAVDSGPQNGSGGAVEGGAVDGGLPEVIGCDAGASASGCGFLDVTLSGGFSASDCCYGCGAGTDGFSWMIDHDRASFQIQFPQGQTPFEQTGAFPLATVLLNDGYGEGGIIGWQTPPGACTVTITRSVCVVAPSGSQDWLSGSGSCTQPAEPTPGNSSAAPVTISDFTFRGYVLMP